MTLENCQKLLKHFNELADGTIPQPIGHKDWGRVVANAKVRAVEMQKRVEHKSSDGFKAKLKRLKPHLFKEEVKEELTVRETKSEEKKSGKKST